MRPQSAAIVLVLGLQVLRGPALAETTPRGDNLLGHRGLVRTIAAHNQPPGTIGLGTDLQYFKASDLLLSGQDHARLVNTFTASWAPLKFIEAALAFHVISDSSAGGPADELQVAVGDPEISLKGSYFRASSGFAVGGLFNLRFPSGVGFFEPAGTAAVINLSALGSWTGGSALPLSLHLNVGFTIDGSENLFDAADLAQLTPPQRFAAQVSSFNRLVTRLGVEYDTRHVGPFLELSLEPFVGSGAPGFGDSPGVLTFGARIWPTRARGLQMLAAVDIGLIGVGDGGGPTLAAGKYAYVLPRWNLVFRVSYRFDPFTKPAAPRVREDNAPVDEGPELGVVTGQVLDERTGQALGTAQIKIDGADGVSRLAVDPDRGTFHTFKLPAGRRTLVVAADGYETAKVAVEVEADGETRTTVRLKPRTSIAPGTIRGTVKGIGRAVKGATVLIPELDRTVQVGPDGVFTVEVQPGTYSVIISGQGYRTQRKSLRVREGTTVILNVELHRR